MLSIDTTILRDRERYLASLLAIKDDNKLMAIIVDITGKTPSNSTKLFEYLNLGISQIRKQNLQQEYVKWVITIHHGKNVPLPDLFRLIQTTVRQKCCAVIMTLKEK